MQELSQRGGVLSLRWWRCFTLHHAIPETDMEAVSLSSLVSVAYGFLI